LSFYFLLAIDFSRLYLGTDVHEPGPESINSFSGLWQFGFHPKYSACLQWAFYGNPMCGR
jgi:hypothetical protein